jgi:DNA-binding HxlR family transcriptional regulator
MNEAEISISEVELVRTLFEHKWRFEVIRRLCEKPQRLSNLKRLIPTASKKMLIDTLHSLEQLGWIVRSDLNTELKHVEYSLQELWADRLQLVVRKIHVDP